MKRKRDLLFLGKGKFSEKNKQKQNKNQDPGCEWQSEEVNKQKLGNLECR